MQYSSWFMSRPRVLKAATLLAVLTAGACSFVIDVDRVTSGDPLSSGDSDAGLSDTGLVDVDDRPPSARRCDEYDPAPLLCDDFDTDAPLGLLWRPPNAKGPGSTVVKDDAAALTVPNALLTRIDADRPFDGGTSHAFVETGLNNPLPPQIRYDFDVRIHEAPSTGIIPLNNFTLGDVRFTLEVDAVGNGTLAVLRSNPTSSKKYPLPALGIDQWRHVAIRVDRSGSPLRVKVDLDDDTVLDETVTGEVQATDSAKVMAGIFYLRQDAGVWTVRLDNVVVRAAP